MKTKFLLAVLLVVLISGCTTPQNLPEVHEIGMHKFGSYIKINPKSSSQISGELIAIDKNNIIVLVSESKRCVKVPISDIQKFNLQYAQPSHYGWSIPVFSLASLVHGWFAILTFPLNLIVTISVTVSGENDFQYNKRSISYHQLRMFSRFPQGIPSNIDQASIE